MKADNVQEPDCTFVFFPTFQMVWCGILPFQWHHLHPQHRLYTVYCGYFYLYLYLPYCHFCVLQPFGHLLGKGLPLGSPVCDVLLCFCHFPIRYPGLGVALDCFDSSLLYSQIWFVRNHNNKKLISFYIVSRMYVRLTRVFCFHSFCQRFSIFWTPAIFHMPRSIVHRNNKVVITIMFWKGIPWKQRLHQGIETRVGIFPRPD